MIHSILYLVYRNRVQVSSIWFQVELELKKVNSISVQTQDWVELISFNLTQLWLDDRFKCALKFKEKDLNVYWNSKKEI